MTEPGDIQVQHKKFAVYKSHLSPEHEAEWPVSVSFSF